MFFCSEDAEVVISIDDFTESVKKENSLTKMDVLACVGSFALQKLNQFVVFADNHLSPLKKKKKKKKKPNKNAFNVQKNYDFGSEFEEVMGSELALTLDLKKKTYNNVPEKRRKQHCPPNVNDVFVGLKDQIERMNGCDILLLAEKALTDSDVKSSLSRLMMPRCRMINNFLTEEEFTFLKNKVGKRWNGLDVSLIMIHPLSGQKGEYCSSKVTLRRWEMNQSIRYVLTLGWNDVVSRNRCDMVQVWSFRVEQKLHLALVIL